MSAEVRIGRVAAIITDFWPHRMSVRAAESIEALYQQETIDAEHLSNQRAWSTETFGPGDRLLGVLDHIRKELVEIEADPADVFEWVDVIILAFDGAWRAGWEPQQIIDAIKAKQAKNEARTWPDWRGMSEDEAIEHIELAPHHRAEATS